MKMHEKLYIKTGIQLTINTINEVGILKFRINMHSVASIYSLTSDDPKFLEIYYLLLCGVVVFL